MPQVPEGEGASDGLPPVESTAAASISTGRIRELKISRLAKTISGSSHFSHIS